MHWKRAAQALLLALGTVMICAGALRGEAAISETKAVLKKKGASYRNIYFDSDSEAGKFVKNVYAYPTTYVVDRSGSIIGEPIVGAVTGKSQMEKLKLLIDQCIAADMR